MGWNGTPTNSATKELLGGKGSCMSTLEKVREEIKEREETIVRLREENYSFVEIAKTLDITQVRVAYIYNRAKKKRNEKPLKIPRKESKNKRLEIIKNEMD